MKDFLIAVFTLASLSALLGLTQRHTVYEKEPFVRQEFENIYQNAQGKQFDVRDTTPTITDLQEGEIVLLSTGTQNLITRIGDTLYSVSLSSF